MSFINIAGGEGYPVACDLQTRTPHSQSDAAMVQERIDLALQISEGGLWDWEIAENRCYFSPQWKRMLGFDADEPLEHASLRWEEVLHPDDFPQMEAQMRAAFVPGAPPLDITCRLRCVDGSYRWVRCRATVIRDAQGAPVRVLGANHDITQTRERNLALVRAKEFSEKLVQSSVAGILAFDTACNITAFNPAIEKIWGAQRAEVLGKNVFDCFGFLRDSHEDRFFYDTLAGKQQTSVERPYVHLKSRRAGQYRAHYVPLTDDSHAVGGGLVFITETSASKIQHDQQRLLLEAGALLANSLDTPTLLQQIVALAVPILCDWCVVTLATTGVKEERGEALGPNRMALAHRDRERSEQLRQALNCGNSNLVTLFSAPAEANETRSEVLTNIPHSLIALLGRDGSDRQLLVDLGFGSYVRVPLAARGQIFGMMVFVTAERSFGSQNITSAELLAHRAALALDNARLYAEAQEAVRVREDVLAMVSHDLKSPLQAITLQCDRTLRRRMKKPDEVAKETGQLASRVRDCAERLNRTIYTILEAARLEGGNFALNKVVAPLHDVLADATQTLTESAAERGIELRLGAHASDVTLALDVERLSQAVVHVLEHAMGQAPAGSTVSMHATHHHGQVAVHIEHDGPGLGPDALSALMRSPWQAHKELSTTGSLGMYVAQQIMRAHGGSIEVMPPHTTGRTALSLHLPARSG